MRLRDLYYREHVLTHVILNDLIKKHEFLNNVLIKNIKFFIFVIKYVSGKQYQTPQTRLYF